MAEKRTIDINIKNNADEATKDFNHFNDALDETAKSAKNVNSTFEEVYGELQPLTTRLGEAEDRLYELALAGDTTSKEYQELLTKVGEYRKVQIQTDLAVDGAATTMTQKLGSALNAATSGFAATQGAMALFGSENEALEKSLLKVQAALAIQQGVKGLSDAYKELSIGTKIASTTQAAFSFVTGGATVAMKAFRGALLATGIGALVIGVVALIENFDKVTAVIKNALSFALKPLKVAIDAVVNAYYAVTDALGITSKAEREREKQSKINAANAKKRAAERKAEFKNLQEEINRTIGEYKRLDASRQKSLDKEIALLKASGKETRNLERQKLVSVIDTETKILQKRIKTLKASEKAGNDWVNFQQKLFLAKQVENAKEAEFQLRVFDTETNKIKSDNYKQYAADRLSIARQIEDLENELLEDGIEKELEINRDKFRRLREDAEKNTKLTSEERLKLIDLYTEQEAQKESEIRNQFFQEGLQEEIDLFENNKLPVLQQQADKEVEVEITKWSLIGQAQQAAFEKERMLRKQNQEFALQTTSDTLNVISGITNLFAGKSEKAAKKAFQIQKAVSIAQATIETYKSANAIFASTAANPISIANPSAPFIAAGVAVAAGLVNVATIASQKFQGGAGGGGAQASAPDLGGGEVAPQFNVVGDSGVNQLAQLQQQPTQAYVVSGDVTSAQALDRNRVQNATL